MDHDAEIPWFIPRKAESNAVYAFVARRGSGKSFAARCLAYHLRDRFRWCAIIMPSTNADNDLSENTPSAFVHMITDYQDGMIQPIIDRANALKAYKKSKNIKRTDSYLFVIDDMLTDANFLKSKDLKILTKRGRHSDNTTILMAQDPKDIKPSVRQNLDYVFLFRQPNKEAKDRAYEVFAPDVKDKKHFMRLLDDLTKDHGIMVIDYKDQKYPVKYFKPCTEQIMGEDGKVRTVCHPGNWRLCCDAAWRLNAQYAKKEAAKMPDFIKEAKNIKSQAACGMSAKKNTGKKRKAAGNGGSKRKRRKANSGSDTDPSETEDKECSEENGSTKGYMRVGTTVICPRPSYDD